MPVSGMFYFMTMKVRYACANVARREVFDVPCALENDPYNDLVRYWWCVDHYWWCADHYWWCVDHYWWCVDHYLLVVCGSLLVVCGSLLVVCGSLLVVCGSLLVVCGSLFVGGVRIMCDVWILFKTVVLACDSR